MCASLQTLLSAFRELLAAPEQSGVPVAQQRLTFRGHVLADVNPAGEPNSLQAVGVVEDGDTLHLVIRADVPPPAAQAPQAPRVNVNRVVRARGWGEALRCLDRLSARCLTHAAAAR